MLELAKWNISQPQSSAGLMHCRFFSISSKTRYFSNFLTGREAAHAEGVVKKFEIHLNLEETARIMQANKPAQDWDCKTIRLKT